ncbi:MAG: hypothetical protein HYX75_24965 [Acidobacteria bacterium]|nr:hypothetical protein [Acidobacteriota bacterium]
MNSTKEVIHLGLALTIAVATFSLTGVRPAEAGGTSMITDVNVYVYKTPRVTQTDSELVNYVTTSMNKIRDAAQLDNITLNVHIEGVTLMDSLSGQVSGRPAPEPASLLQGYPGANQVAITYYQGQLEINGWRSGDPLPGWAVVDVDPTDLILWDWDDQAITTHELGHLFGALDDEGGVMDKKFPNGSQDFSAVSQGRIQNYIRSKWPNLHFTPAFCGDVTMDGRADVVDSLFIAQYTVDLRKLTSDQMLNGNVNNDTVVSIVDALLIAQGGFHCLLIP